VDEPGSEEERPAKRRKSTQGIHLVLFIFFISLSLNCLMIPSQRARPAYRDYLQHQLLLHFRHVQTRKEAPAQGIRHSEAPRQYHVR
jgi:hypothetical protein